MKILTVIAQPPPPPPLPYTPLPVSESVLLFGASLIVGAFGFFVTREVKSMDKRIDRIENTIDLTKSDLSNLPLQYVSRDDYLRTVTALEDRLDRLEQKLDDKLDRIIGFVAREG
jgi:hypothetical protein